ncbi:hypothetical protein PQI66_00525 [Corynebacterium sp. USCH3]|uniref:hypothetical protein n=1 Tax=Corynebacterium sp. USCH3 TaxID=3024840 RepID=UPI0030AE55EE
MTRALAPLGITVALLVLRGWQLSQRTFYWDDLVIPARFHDTGLWVPYDGHLMPGSAAVQILVDRVAPLQWWLPAAVTLCATAVAAALWWCLLGRLTGRRPVRILAFTALMFSPFLGVASGWWSAGVNALAWQITAAGVGLILLSAPARGTARSLVSRSLAASVMLCAGLLMTEKVLSVVPALLVVAVVWRAGGRRVRVKPFALPALLTTAWAVLYLVLVDRGPATGPSGLDGTVSALGSSVLPGILGGPWSWDRWNPSPAFSTTPGWAQLTTAGVVVGLVVAYVLVARPRRVAGLAAAAGSVGYLTVVLLLLREGRAGEGATDLLARGMHYYADWWTVTVVLLVAALPLSAAQSAEPPVEASPAPRPTRPPTRRGRTTSTFGRLAAVLFAASSAVSTLTWVTAWSTDDTGDYLAGVRQAVADAGTSGRTLPDQQTPLEVLTPLMSPYNTVSAIAGRLPDSAAVGAVTTSPQIVTPDGEIVEARVLDVARSAQGDIPACGVRVDVGQPQIIVVEPALPFGDWTWEFTSTADQPVTVRLSTPNGLEDEDRWRSRAVDVAVDAELTTRWVNLAGGGGTILAEVDGPPGSHVCVGAGAVGPLVAR